MEEIGLFLGRVREKAGMTQAEVARLRQASRGSQSQLELSGANPRWASIENLATAIGARVTLRFDLFNGTSVEMLAGQIAPSLRAALHAERDRWAKNSHFESRIAANIAGVVEPGRWARQNALRVLLSAAIGENLQGQAAFDFVLDFGHWEDDEGNWDLDGRHFVEDSISVLEDNRVALKRLIEEVVSLAKRGRSETSRDYLKITSIPAFVDYVAEGAPGAQEAADRMVAIGADPVKVDFVLEAIGFLPVDPRDKAKR